jgi:ABC-2 type transport system permease protein
MRPALAVVIRILAFIGKEMAETLRRPGAVVSLVLGPFLIMAIFGLGYDGVRRPLETIVVMQPSSGLASDAAAYQRLAGGGLDIVDVTPDRAAAEARLVAGEVDVVIVAPPDPEDDFVAGRQSVLEVMVNAVDPIAAANAGFLAAGLSSAVNREIVERVVEEGQDYAMAAGEGSAAQISPRIVASPTRAELQNVAPSTPGVLAYFGPAVLALILQHVAVSLVALSLVRERMSGVIELFRIAPVSTVEVLVGKMLAFGLVAGGIAAMTVALLVGVFRIPMLADPWMIAGIIVLLLAASLGIGALIAVVSDSERQAVQLSLLLLLASVFFSGFVLAIEEFSDPVRAIAALLPVTHGIRLLQDLMLRGAVTQAWGVVALALIALTTSWASWLLLRRGMSRG